ncbi:hypothetical protein ACFY3Y_00495 [Streptomyces sp. NPDC000656]|uniref:hypothetical protein n=1 Tax=Streptomyces sp. NPDC000656 TaxID=3364540 RepID=UPI0036BAAE5F
MTNELGAVVTHTRLVHMGAPNLAAQRSVFRAYGWKGGIEIESVLDGDVTNSGVDRYRALDGLVLGLLPGAPGRPVPARPARHQRPLVTPGPGAPGPARRPARTHCRRPGTVVPAAQGLTRQPPHARVALRS